VPELQVGRARAPTNRWLAELCARGPGAAFGVAAVPLLWDVEEAVRECATPRLGLRGAMIRT